MVSSRNMSQHNVSIFYLCLFYLKKRERRERMRFHTAHALFFLHIIMYKLYKSS